MTALNILLYVPEACHRMPKDHNIPVFVFMDQAGATTTMTLDTGEHPQTYEGSIGLFIKIIWIGGLKTKGNRVLTINAHKDGFDDPPPQQGTIHRNPVDVTRRKPVKGKYGTPPNITSPSNGSSVPPNFAAWGTVVQGESPCTAWLLDPTNNNTYPGMPIPGQPANNFAFGFQNIPAGAPPGTKYTLYVQTSTGDQSTVTVYVQTGM